MANFIFRRVRSLALLVGCVLTASCGDVISCGFLDKDEVCVSIVNQSGVKIKSLQIFYKQGSKEVVNIDNESTATITFNIRDESSFTLKAQLDGNETVESHEVYIEGGYQETATVLRDTIAINRLYK